MPEDKQDIWGRWRQRLGRWEFWVSSLSVLLTIGIIIALIFYWEQVRSLGSLGYFGAFIISLFGGATILAPIPMTPVVFTLGAIMRPDFAPGLGFVFVGLAAGIGETIAALTIYYTGYGGGGALAGSRFARIRKAYVRVTRWIQNHGTLVLFILSATVNPFFYPAALASGALRYSLKRYVLICLAGKIVKGVSVAAAGYYGLGQLLRVLGVPI
jgi:membrane protein DedA with SNARE-associated domain